MNITKYLGKGWLSSFGILSLVMALVLGLGSQSYAQTTSGRTVKGKVVDERGEPLTGASIRIVGTTSGVSADLDGAFTLTLPAGKNELLVSFVGYKDQKVVAKNGMTIKMQPDSQALSEVVVTGMVATDKRLFTGASDKLTADKVKMDGMPDVSRGLEGRSAGVSVQNVSGTFGTAPKIRVRGATSILGSSKPLWVVDGVIQEDIVQVGADDLSSGDATTLISSAIAGLNADDIESFQILKDGSATSIYGAKAMAGVIVITTKKGRKGTSSFSYTGEFTSRLVPSYRDFNIMNSQDQVDIYRELERKGHLRFAETYRAGRGGLYAKMYQLTHQYDPATGKFGLANTPEAREAYLREAELRNTDWFDELFSPAVMQNHSVSMTSGTENSQTYASLSVMTDPGWMYKSKVSRYTFNVNTTYNLSKNLSLTAIGGAAYRNQTAPGTLGAASDPVSGEVTRDFDINPFSYALNTSRAIAPDDYYTNNYAPFNIKNELNNNYMELNVIDLKYQAELKWKPFREMTVTALGSLKYSTTGQRHMVTEHSNQALAFRAMGDPETQRNNPFLYKNPDKLNELPNTILPRGGFYNMTNYKLFSQDFRLSAAYNTELAGTHIINSYAGMEVNAQDRTRDAAEGWGLQYDNGERPFWDYLAFKKMKEDNQDYYLLSNTFGRTVAFFATATYSYKGRYTLTGTGRYEGSNRLGRARTARWLPTWNIATAWNAHEEDFFKNYLSKHLSHLTFKASYSLTGDAGPTWITNSLAVIGSSSPWRPSAPETENANEIIWPENNQLTYEKKHELNVGVDMGLLNNRISITADWYQRNNFDLIGVTNTVAGIRYGNVASMKSHGFELSVSTKNIQSKRFNWTTDFIFGYNQTEITDLDTRSNLFNFINGVGYARKGYPVRALFSIPFEGLNDQGLPTFKFIDHHINQDNYRLINFQERQHLGFLKYEGPTDPTFNGSFGNIFTFDNFKLNVFVTYSGGNKIRLDPVFRAVYSDFGATPKDFKDRWTMAGEEARTDIPVIPSLSDNRNFQSLNVGYNAYNYSTARVADGTFVRLKEVSLSYDLPKSWLKNMIIKSASLKVQATNLALLYADPKLKGQDPEFFRSGGVAAPVPKQITATLRIGF